MPCRATSSYQLVQRSALVPMESVAHPARTVRMGIELCMLLQGNYFEAAAVDVDHDKRLIRCKFPKEFKGGPEDSTQEFMVPYDVLVFAVSVGA